MRQQIVIFPGTFDPITNGHIDLIERAAKMFETMIIAVAKNVGKNPCFDLTERIELIEEVLKDLSNVKVEEFSNLLVDFAHAKGARLIIRGVRVMSDVEYELQLSRMNRKLHPDIETVFLPSADQYSSVSSSLIREIAQMGGNVNAFVPNHVAKALKKKFQER